VERVVAIGTHWHADNIDRRRERFAAITSES
jgi:hypothetical protein